MSASFDLPEVDQFLCGTVGPPGQRVFFLQVVANGRVLSLRAEKQQVALLADYLERILAVHDLPPGGEAHFGHLIEPPIAEWTVGEMAVAIDEMAGRVVLVIEELPPPQDEPMALDVERGSLRIALTREQLEAFVAGARAVIAAGRPICRFCGRSIDPDGHACPRMN
jgi:uncharacterized repeat protein (TIGR03847 family)